ncbi:MAG: DapH/DapD/GlmU-related protein [Bdellovibrionota bacterium]
MISFLIPFFYFLIYGSATLAAAIPIVYSSSKEIQLLSIIIAPVSFSITFILVAGLLSQIGKKAIFPGSFERSLKDKIYGPRRLYGACWTALFYFSPLYFVCLSLPPLKKLVFRLFGYTGPVDFTIYPDTWVRDLPCLLFEEGAYIANKSTLGTNMCLTDGNILVDRIKIGKKAMVGHIAMIGPGVKLRDNVEIGLGCTIGIRSTYKKGSKVQPCAVINHGAVIGENCIIGTNSYLGLKVQILDNIHVPAGSNIPAGTTIESQEQADSLHAKETESLINHKINVLNMLTAKAEAARTG